MTRPLPHELDLLQMVRDAHEGCRQEHMSCPWCSGRIDNNEWHDLRCPWLQIQMNDLVAAGLKEAISKVDP